MENTQRQAAIRAWWQEAAEKARKQQKARQEAREPEPKESCSLLGFLAAIATLTVWCCGPWLVWEYLLVPWMGFQELPFYTVLFIAILFRTPSTVLRIVKGVPSFCSEVKKNMETKALQRRISAKLDRALRRGVSMEVFMQRLGRAIEAGQVEEFLDQPLR